MLDAGHAVGNLGEIAYSQLFLFLETKWAVVSRHDTEVVSAQSAPQVNLVAGITQRWRTHKLCTFETLTSEVRLGKK